MREALVQARWSPVDDPEEVLATLQRLSDGVTGVVADPDTGSVDMHLARAVFASDTLADVYLFAAALLKSIDQQHRANPAGRAMSRSAFVRWSAHSFVRIHQEQRKQAAALDEAFPPDE